MEVACLFESDIQFTKSQLESWLRPMGELERLVFSHRFGLMDGVAHTLQETGDLMGIDRERVRRIEIRACRKARDGSR